jgi:pentose-5-phosphate-3-epimerase/putative flippase GtrA
MIFSDEFKKNIFLFFFKNYHIILYVIFGVMAITIELIFRRILININLNEEVAVWAGLGVGIFVAFFLNVKYNFSIPKRKIIFALTIFCVISLCSLLVQRMLIEEYIDQLKYSYELSRLIISGSTFIIAYAFHKRFSFRDSRMVGVAVYANGLEDISKIKQKIRSYPDFIHVDIVDKTIKEDIAEVTAYRLEAIRAHWPKTEIHTHIMSNSPSYWIKEAATYSDVVFIHDNIKEDLKDIKNKIRFFGSEPGLAIHAKNNYNNLQTLMEDETNVLILSIESPGQSGQIFLDKAYSLIKNINSLSNRENFKLCVDGGVTDRNICTFDSDYIVSGSNVLNAKEPFRQIINLKTLNNYSRPID